MKIIDETKYWLIDWIATIKNMSSKKTMDILKANPPKEELVTIASNIAKESDIRIINVYGQYAWHDDVRIIGNKQGLLNLMHLISDAIVNGKSSTNDYGYKEDIMTSDGEGYTLTVECHNDPWLNTPKGYWATKESQPYYEIMNKYNDEQI